MTRSARAISFVLAGMIALSSTAPLRAWAASGAELRRDSAAALRNLTDSETAARLLAEKAKGILVFPSIVKGGFMVGGQIGEGVLWKKSRAVAYYNSVAA